MTTDLASSSALHTLVDISQGILDSATPEEGLRVIQEAVLKLFSVEGCSIGLVEKDTGWLAFFAMEGKTKTDEFRVPPGRGIAGWVVEHGKPVFSNNTQNDERFFNAIDQKTGHTTQSLLCVPLIVKMKVIGVIEALNTHKPGGFTLEDLELLSRLGNLAETSITRTRKYGVLQTTGAAYREDLENRYQLIGGHSPPMRKALDIARTVAQSNTTVLLMSESGTGKEVVSRAIHNWSSRSSQPFIAVNCVALTPELLASELFGHEKGSFTGAVVHKKGKFELADGGTIFLDEIGDLSLDLQVKLLRVLQDREFQRVGGSRDIRTDVRIIAATNRDLRQAIEEGTFREDLYYRLNVISIALPPLRERIEDIEPLVTHFIARFVREMSRPPLKISHLALEALMQYPWPGNVRELQNVIERAVVLSPGHEIDLAALPMDIVGGKIRAKALRHSFDNVRMFDDFKFRDDGIDPDLTLADAVEIFKKQRVFAAMKSVMGKRKDAAKKLGLQPSNLSRLLKKWGIND